MMDIVLKVMLLSFMVMSVEAKNCWKIKNADTRALCESKFEGKKNCWLIKEADMKAYCEATAYGKNACWKIRNSDYKEMCIAESGN